MTLNVSIIGVGRIGGALAIALSEKGYNIGQLVSRQNNKSEKIAELIDQKTQVLSLSDLNKISADVVFITTPDPEIRATAEKFASSLVKKPIVFHTSGALSSEVLKSLEGKGCKTASLHPLVSISEPILGAKRFKAAFFCVEGEREACKAAEKIVSDLEGNSFSIPTEFKTLYHASAVMTSGHTTALFSIAVETLAKCGLDKKTAQAILLPLLKSTVENLFSQTPSEALTGTFARADIETLNHHLESLHQNVSPETLKIYIQLGLQSIKLAEENGADSDKLEAMKGILKSSF